jgi:hypothetical protein
MSKIWTLGFILITGVFVCWGTACSTNGTIFLNISNEASPACNVVCTLDGGSPVTNSGNGGPYTLWSNVSHGNHKIGISTPSATSACNYDITGGGQTINVNYPCNPVGGNNGFTCSCN